MEGSSAPIKLEATNQVPKPTDSAFASIPPRHKMNEPESEEGNFFLIRVKTIDNVQVTVIKAPHPNEIRTVLEKYSSDTQDFSPTIAAEYFCRLGGFPTYHPHRTPDTAFLPLFTLEDAATRDWNDVSTFDDGIVVGVGKEDGRSVFKMSRIVNPEAMTEILPLFPLTENLIVKDIVALIQALSKMYCCRGRRGRDSIVSKAVPVVCQTTTITEVTVSINSKVVGPEGRDDLIGARTYSTTERRKRKAHHDLLDDFYPVIMVQTHSTLPAVCMSRKRTWKATA